MIGGLVRKTVRESWVGTALFCGGVALFQLIMGIVLPTFFEQLAAQVANIPFIRNVFRALLGPVGERFGPDALMALPWVHPVVLALLWTHAITFGTRVPAAEVERGTADFLFGLPASRRQVWAAEGLVLLAWGVLLGVAGLIGNVLGNALSGSEHVPAPWQLFAIATNQLALYMAVAGFSCWVSAGAERRGRAVGAAFGIVLGSFFVGVLAQFWQPARHFVWLGLLHYYEPHAVLQGGGWPVGNTSILAGFGVAIWLLGGRRLGRRDL